ncbi:MAG: 1-acyl-sn-glycerol-3-phosphate acyltransferase [Candidatus Limimorpha sp.]
MKLLIPPHRQEVMDNIRKAVADRDFYRVVEIDDPVISDKQIKQILDWYEYRRSWLSYAIPNLRARTIVNRLTRTVCQDTDFVGTDNLRNIEGGAIITSNHFNPYENALIRQMVSNYLGRRFFVVSHVNNFAQRGFFGFLMKYADLIPIYRSPVYLHSRFDKYIRTHLQKGHLILIYTEQEMWFNYRKPRPLAVGAYYYAARNHVPVISCFVEIQDTDRMIDEHFSEVHCTVHILPTILPDPNLSDKENAHRMAEQDYAQKKAAYEAAYGKELTYDFEDDDIAGYRP